MKILILGGTKFLGRHLTDAALAGGHAVTLFNRGRKYADEPLPAVETIHGDRHFDLEKLAGRNWDAVVDTSGYLPPSVEKSAGFLADKVGRYVFISSGSVYENIPRADYDETTETAQLAAAAREKFENFDPARELNAAALGESYGALKKLCEEAAESALPDRVLSVRAGMIVGPFDLTDRFNYWVLRVARGGRVLAPGAPANFVQLIDARDLSEWIVAMIERGASGVFNATSRSLDLTFEKMLEEIKTTLGSDAEFVWADDEFLAANAVAPWSAMPFYLPESDAQVRHFLTMNVDRALAAGLKFRPLRETIRDVREWRARQDFEMRAGISPEREAELLEKLQNR